MELDAQRVRQVEGNGALESTLKRINVIEKLQRLRREWSSVENLQRTLSWKPKEVFPRELIVSMLTKDQIAQEVSCEH